LKVKNVPLLKLFLFYCLQIFLHQLLDTCNAYGTGLLEPFSHERFSFHLLFVADPFLYLSIIIAFFVLWAKKMNWTQRKKWVWVGLVPACLYFVYAVYNKSVAAEKVSSALTAQGIPQKNYITTPAAFNTWVWYIVASTDSGFYTGYRSVFDKGNPDTLVYHPRNLLLLKGHDTTREMTKLIRFAQDHYTVAYEGDSLVVNVLRFGQVAGWQDPRAPFVFQYHVNHSEDDLLLMQRGRFKGWSPQSFRNLFERIGGK
jgi:inner membrane protein